MRYIIVFLFTCLTAVVASANSEKNNPANSYFGPDEIVMKSTVDKEQKEKPAFLPHKQHQWLDCDACHHGRGPDGKIVPYKKGILIEKCESCHNSKQTMPVKVATLKRAGHRLCMECHRQQNKELAQCIVCHKQE